MYNTIRVGFPLYGLLKYNPVKLRGFETHLCNMQSVQIQPRKVTGFWNRHCYGYVLFFVDDEQIQPRKVTGSAET